MNFPGSGGAQRTAPGVPVELELSGSVDESWLAEHDDVMTDYLRRLEADRSIVDELRAAGFQGIHYDYFATELTKYALAVMTAWIVTAQIFPKMRARGMGGLPEPLGHELRNQDEAESLAGETIAESLRNFRQYVLIPGRWNPERGASIRTYFIGQCLLRFANIYRAWHRNTYERAEWGYRDEVGEADAGSSAGDVERDAIANLRSTEFLSRVKQPRTREIFVRSAAGWTHEEIAELLGITPKAVEMSIRNERNRQKETG